MGPVEIRTFNHFIPPTTPRRYTMITFDAPQSRPIWDSTSLVKLRSFIWAEWQSPAMGVTGKVYIFLHQQWKSLWLCLLAEQALSACQKSRENDRAVTIFLELSRSWQSTPNTRPRPSWIFNYTFFNMMPHLVRRWRSHIYVSEITESSLQKVRGLMVFGVICQLADL
jgi:hypothetical protein